MKYVSYRINKPLTTVVILICLIVAAPIFISCKHKDNKSSSENSEKIVYHCPMHPNYMSNSPGKCPICGMDLVPVDRQQGADSLKEVSGNGVEINPNMIQNMGVKTEKAERRSLMKEIRANASITPDERRIYSVTSRINGYIEKLHVNYTGQAVQKGEPLYDIFSPDLVSAQNEYLSALKRIKGADSIDPLAQSALKRLQNWNFPETDLKELEQTHVAKRVLTMKSPADGIVVDKMVTDGQAIEPGMTLYKIIDYSRVWALCSIYQQDVSFVRVGQKAELSVDNIAGLKFYGSVTYISPELDMESRTLTVRIEFSNTPDLLLKPGMVATANIFTSARPEVVAVPSEAVIHSGLRSVIIISRGDGYFEPREVKTGITANGFTEILSGVAEGEEIVISSQFLIDSESNLKAAVMQLAPSSGADTSSSNSYKADEKQLLKQLYTCPMHPEIIRDKPGQCPICGMNLVPKK